MRALVIIVGLITVFTCSPCKGQSNTIFDFEPDERLFTVYAFMNAAGYDHDWKKEMHPIRTAVRQHLDTVLSSSYREEIRDYYQTHGGSYFNGYGDYSLNTTSAPQFNIKCDTCQIDVLDHFEGLNKHLKAFYSKANLSLIWKMYQVDLRNINYTYEPHADQAIRQIVNYLKLPPNFYENKVNKIHWAVCPQMSHFTAYVVEVRGEMWLVKGPSDSPPSPSAFFHEALHPVTTPIIEKHLSPAKKIEELLPLAQEKLKGSYNSLEGLISESLVRALDRGILTNHNTVNKDRLGEIIESEYKLGHILTFYFYESMQHFQKAEMTLEEYYLEMIENLDVAKEKKRWGEYWTKK